jgi:hypothetical protein
VSIRGTAADNGVANGIVDVWPTGSIIKNLTFFAHVESITHSGLL